MAYVPTVPGYSPVSYGQGYGDWQQYAGYTKDNPFGASPGFLPKNSNQPKSPIAPPMVPEIKEIKPVDYSLPPIGQFGAPTQNSLGVNMPNQLGQVQDFTSILKKDEDDF